MMNDQCVTGISQVFNLCVACSLLAHGTSITLQLYMSVETWRVCVSAFLILRTPRHTAIARRLRFYSLYSISSYGYNSSTNEPCFLYRHSLVDVVIAARLIFGLHWLRIPQRIQFKVAVLTYKVLHGCAPSYLGPFVHVTDLPS